MNSATPADIAAIPGFAHAQAMIMNSPALVDFAMSVVSGLDLEPKEEREALEKEEQRIMAAFKDRTEENIELEAAAGCGSCVWKGTFSDLFINRTLKIACQYMYKVVVDNERVSDTNKVAAGKGFVFDKRLHPIQMAFVSRVSRGVEEEGDAFALPTEPDDDDEIFYQSSYVLENLKCHFSLHYCALASTFFGVAKSRGKTIALGDDEPHRYNGYKSAECFLNDSFIYFFQWYTMLFLNWSENYPEELQKPVCHIFARLARNMPQLRFHDIYATDDESEDDIITTMLRFVFDEATNTVSLSILDYLYHLREQVVSCGDDEDRELFERMRPHTKGEARRYVEEILTEFRVQESNDDERKELIDELLSEGKSTPGTPATPVTQKPQSYAALVSKKKPNQPAALAAAPVPPTEKEPTAAPVKPEKKNKREMSRKEKQQAKVQQLVAAHQNKEKEAAKKKPRALRGDINDLPAAKAQMLKPQEYVEKKDTAAAATAAKQQTKVTKTGSLDTYATIDKLYTVVMVRKLHHHYPRCTIKATSDPSEKTDFNKIPYREVNFTVTGPSGQVNKVLEEIEAQARRKARRFETESIPKHINRDGSSGIEDRIFSVSHHFNCVVNFSKTKKGLIFNAVQLLHEDPEEFSDIIPEVEEYLAASAATAQQFRVLNNRNDNDDDSDDNRLHSTGVAHGTKVEADDMRRSRVVVSEHMYRKELNFIATLPHYQAVERLRDLVHRHKNAWQSDVLAWHRFLYEVEEQFCMAVLAQYELHNHQLTPANANIYTDMVCCTIDLTTGIPPFTERRPSIGVDDTITIQFRNGKERKLKVHYYTANRVIMKIVPSLDDTSVAELTTSGPVSVKFDPVPFRLRCASLRKGANNVNEFNWLQDPRIFFSQTELIQNIPARVMENKVPVRSVRGRGTGQNHMINDAPRNLREHCKLGLNTDQLAAIYAVMDSPPELDRLTLVGPPGTGKTETLCRLAVLLVGQYEAHERLVITAPTANAVDVITRRIAELFKTCNRPELAKTLFRFSTPSTHPLNTPHDTLRFTNIALNGKGAIPEFSELTADSRFEKIEDLQEDRLKDVRIICTNVSNIKSLHKADARLGLANGASHVFIDEAAQTHLSDALSALTFARLRSTFVLLSGDEEQIRPYVVCPFVRSFLQKSPMNFNTGKSKMSSIFLQHSYRASRSLVDFQSSVFYGNKLQYSQDGGYEGSALDDWNGHFGNPSPIKFFHVEGEVEQDGHSFTNKNEISTCYDIAFSLYKGCGVQPKDMVVISKFLEQRNAIRQRLQMGGMKQVRVVDIQDFNGDERDVVIVSLVKQEYEQYNAECGFFVRNELNAVVGRAMSLIVFVGNGKTLIESHNRTWKALLDRVAEDHAINGYDYDNEEFATEHSKRIELPKGELVVKEFVPVSRVDRNSSRRIVHVDEVLAQPHHYFIGTVVKNNGIVVTVRNRAASALDVIVDVETSIGTSKMALFPGDVVAMRIDDSRARWILGDKVGQLAARCEQEVSKEAFRNVGQGAHNEVVLAAAGTYPPCMTFHDTDSEPVTPRGTVASLIYHATVPMIPCHVVLTEDNYQVMQPINPAYPALPYAGEVNQQHGSIYMCNVSDRRHALTHYIVCGCCQEYPKLRSLPPTPRTFSTGSHIVLPPVSQLRQLTDAYWHPNGRLLVKLQSEKNMITGETTIQVWTGVPLMIETDEDEEDAIFSAVFGTLGARRGRFKPKEGIPCLTFTFTIHIKNTAVSCDRFGMDIRRMELADPKAVFQNFSTVENLLPVARGTKPRVGALPDTMSEVELWVGHIAALELVEQFPDHALLKRQMLAPRTNEQIKQGDLIFEGGEWFIPATKGDRVNISGSFCNAQFPTGTHFTQICDPSDRFTDTVTLRLLLLCIHRRDGNVLGPVDMEFVRSIPFHVTRFNAFARAYANFDPSKTNDNDVSQ